MSAVVLKEVGPSEAGTILRIIHAAFAEYVGAIDPPSGAPNETEEKLVAKMRGATPIIAYVDGEPVACAFYELEGDHLYLFRLAVLPEYRRQGIGRMLIEYVEDRAATLGLPAVTLGVRVALPHLRTRYEAMGYRLVEERTHPGYDAPTWIMLRKELA